MAYCVGVGKGKKSKGGLSANRPADLGGVSGADDSHARVPADGIISDPAKETLPLWALVAMAGLAWLAVAAFARGIAPMLYMLLTDGLMGAGVLLSAGGWGYLVCRHLKVARAHGMLIAATSAAVGFWMLGTALLIVGSLVPGALTPWVWWPVVGAGIVLALVQARPWLSGARLPRRVGPVSLVWVLIAAAGALWLAGASLPAGLMGSTTGDAYDILEYHLQAPREFFLAGRVGVLGHNIYSHYPLGVEMLFLLAMCLRDGAYEGMALAQLMPALFGVLLGAGTYGFFRSRAGAAGGAEPTDAEALRSRLGAAAGVVLMVTAPWVIYLGQIAMDELPELAYVGLAVLWMGVWLREPAVRPAVLTGLMLGGACATKYLGVGFAVLPVLAVMAAVAVRRPRLLGQVALAGVVALILFSPWLVRNTIATANPVFPLGMSVFGQDGLNDELAQRWQQGHAPGDHPPVPVPPEWKPTPSPYGELERVGRFFLGVKPYNVEPSLGPVCVLALAGTIVFMLARPRAAGGFAFALLAVAGIQVAVWALFTRNMPGRFITPIVAPVSLLAAMGIARLGTVRKLPWLPQAASAGEYWGLAPAGLLLAAAGVLNLAAGALFYKSQLDAWRVRQVELVSVGEQAAREMASVMQHGPLIASLPPQSRVLVVGYGCGFYLPPSADVATVFNRQPLEDVVAESADPAQVAAGLRRRGYTHVMIDWNEVDRLRRTYGWPATLSPQRLLELTRTWKLQAQFPTSTATQPAEPIISVFAIP